MINILVGLLTITAFVLVPYIIGKITSASTDIDANEFLDVWILGTLVIVAVGIILIGLYFLGALMLNKWL